MEDRAKKWLVNKLREGIISCCCEISNLCGHKYPFDQSKLDKPYLSGHPTVRELIDKNLDKIAMLIGNFPEYIDPKTVIDDYFTEDKKLPIDKQNHWGTGQSGKEHIRDFKCFVKESMVKVRDTKLENIL